MFKFLVLALSMLALPALADGTPPPSPDCTPVRQAKLKVNVWRTHWSQDSSGVWSNKTELVCQGGEDSFVNVFDGVMKGCQYERAMKCEVVLDGTTHNVSVYGIVYHVRTTPTPTKHFLAQYALEDGEFSNASVITEDLGLKKIGLNLVGAHTRIANSPASTDSISVTGNFEDSNAP